jgi:hypothetical protein
MRTVSIAWLLMLIFSGRSHGGLFPTSVRPLHLGYERDQVRLCMMSYAPSCLMPEITADGIVVSHDGRLLVPRDLNQLRGLVRVTDGEAALRFVRLRTSPATWHAWPAGVREVEVVAAADLQSQPDFGLRELRYPVPGVPSGYLGILPGAAYRASQFTAPKVETVGEGFRITRWIYRQTFSARTATVQQIQEMVTEVGEYRRSVVKQIAPPELPGVVWELPDSR